MPPFLQKSGIPCVVLERRDRAYIETPQRAGVIDSRAVKMFEDWGLADKLLSGPAAYAIEYRLNGSPRLFIGNEEIDNGAQSLFCTQQMLVNNLLRDLIDVTAGDVRFKVPDASIRNEINERPQVTYTDESGRHEITCDYIVGCDADRGVSRSSIPEGLLTKYSYEYGYACLAALVEAPVTGYPIMAVSEHDFAAQLPRGPQRNRYYLQCALSDNVADWPDERIWDEIRLRTGDGSVKNVHIHNIEFSDGCSRIITREGTYW